MEGRGILQAEHCVDKWPVAIQERFHKIDAPLQHREDARTLLGITSIYVTPSLVKPSPVSPPTTNRGELDDGLLGWNVKSGY